MVRSKMPAGCVIGVDLGGTKVLAGAVDAALTVHHRARRLVGGTNSFELLDTVAEAVDEARNAAPGPVAAVGVGLPAVLDAERRTARFSTHLPLEGLPFGEQLSTRVGLPVVLDNDANLALLAELHAGVARGARHALLLTLGTGIGGAVLIDGELLRGARGGAGELGHVVVDFDGPRCQGKCPNRGCLEVMASGTALEREAAALAARRPGSGLAGEAMRGGRLTGPRVSELARAGDASAIEVLELIGRRLGTGISGLVNVFDPEIVVIGGGVVEAGELLLAPARAEVRARALPPASGEVRVEAASFGEEAGVIGGAVLAFGSVPDRSPA